MAVHALASRFHTEALALGFRSWAPVSGVATLVVACSRKLKALHPKFSGPSSAFWVWVLASFNLSAQGQEDSGYPS